ncbi:MAG TPA: HAMP domain-containing sensor histidine kinase [Terriglobales bacterium]|nr:HAMP domain-containing sensor histidine kinase [Terriglobales bacterium]
MVHLRLRTKFLLSMLLVSAGLTCTTLLLVRHSVEGRVRQEIFHDLDNSVASFQNFQRLRALTLSRSAQLLADLPDIRALMTSHDAATIQDASQHLWQLAGNDLFLLADPVGKVMALHGVPPEFTAHTAQELLPRALADDQSPQWWYGAGHLYEVFLQPIYFGRAAENHVLGYLALGYEIDDRVAQEVRRVSASQVAFRYGDSIVRSTLNPSQETELLRQTRNARPEAGRDPDQIQLGEERFLTTSVELAPGATPAVRLSVLKSLDQATAFLSRLNQLLLAFGLAAVLAGSGLVFLISHTFTRPLGNLVAGVRALEHGDFAYPLEARGGDEVAEVTGAFDRMRTSLQTTQAELLDAERLATIGRMASSISHDLRHSLAAIIANAEFLCETNLTPAQREELYGEIRIAVNQMTELIESLLEFSRTRESLRPSLCDLRDAVERAIQNVRAHPEYHGIKITVSCECASVGWFDARKLERAFQNLLLNACEAVADETGQIQLTIRRAGEGLEILIADNGPGIAESVRDRLFDPFVSYGKENGTGMGLTVVQKILQDHGGDIVVERSSPQGTVFKLHLPLKLASARVAYSS